MSNEIFKAFIGGLPYDSLASDVETILGYAEFSEEQIRSIEIHLVHDKETGSFKGFGYVTFPTEEQVEQFIAKTDNVEFGKRVLKVNRAQQRDRNDRGGRGGGRGGFGGDRGGRGGGGFRRGGDHRGGHRGGFHDGGRGGFDGGRGGFGGGNRRQRKESEEFGGSQHEDSGRTPRQSEDGASSAPAAPAQRPRLNLKPRTTDSSEIEARKKQEEEETKKRQQKLFG